MRNIDLVDRKAMLSTVSVLAGLAMSAWLTPASAVMIQPNTHPGEPGLNATMTTLYGAGNFTQLDSTQSQVWPLTSTTRGDVSANFQIRYAADSSAFGYFRDGGSNFTQLFGITAASNSMNGSTSVALSSLTSNTATGTYTWGFQDTQPGYVNTFSSMDGANPDGLSHMIAFLITPPNYSGVGTVTYALAWEDRTLQEGSDRDFQDAIIQIAVDDPPASDPIPEPTTLSVLGIGLIGLGYAKGRRNTRPHALTKNS